MRKSTHNPKENDFKEEEFEVRYPVKKIVRYEKKEVFKESFLREGEKNIEKMRKVPGRAQTMDYFDEMSRFPQRVREIGDFKKSGGKVVGTFCNFAPEELVYAAGALPIRLCAGFYETTGLAEEVLPGDICPLIKSSFGCKMAEMPYFEFCDVIILPTSCDGKKKLGEILSAWLPVWVLQLPNSKDNPQSKELWFWEIKRLEKRLEKLTAQKIEFSKFKKAIQVYHHRQVAFRRLYEIRKFPRPVITGRDALLVTQTSFFDDPIRWAEKTENLCQELEEHVKKGESVSSGDTCRLLLTGAPIIWPNYKIPNIVEEFGGIIVGDTLCSGTQHLYNPVEIDEWVMEEMLKAVAERYLLPSICPCFVQGDDRIDNLLQMIKDFKIEGVIYHQLRLCQLYDLEFQKVKQVLDRQNLPILRIQTDYSQEDVEQIKTRIEAFLEMLKGKR